MMPPVLARVAGSCALLVGVLGLQYLVAEALLRIVWSGSTRASTSDATPPAGFWDLTRPNFRGIDRGVAVQNNSRGLRGPEWSAVPGEGVFRILVLGDSVTNGAGVEEGDRYTSQLERALNRPGGHPRYEVVNAGIQGLNIGPLVGLLERTLGYYRAHLLVYGFTLNDLQGEAYRDSGALERITGWLRWAQGRADSPSHVWRFLSQRIFLLMTRSDRLRVREDLRDNYFANPQAWADFEAGLDRIAAIAREQDICVVMLMHTALDRLDAAHPYLDVYEWVGAAASARGFAVVPSFPYFEGKRAPALHVSPYDPHPNAEGHALLSRALESGLRDLPDGCWELPPAAP